MTTGRGTTKDQHSVPKFYLKPFSRCGKIQILDVQARRILKTRHYTRVCFKKLFYAVDTGVLDDTSQSLETKFGQTENVVARALPKIIKRAEAQELTADDLGLLASFMSIQWLRTAHFRKRVESITSEFMKWVTKITFERPGTQNRIRTLAEDPEMSDEQVEKVQEFIQSGEYDFRQINNVLHLRLLNREHFNGFSNLLLDKKWRIIFAKEPHHFITSDNPVAEWTRPSQGLYNASFMDRYHLLAVTPRMLIETAPPNGIKPNQSPLERLSYSTANERGVLMFNTVLANSAHQFAYSARKGDLQTLLDSL